MSFDIICMVWSPSTIIIIFYSLYNTIMIARMVLCEEVQVGKDQEKAQSEKDSHSKNRGGKKTKLTIRYLYHENIS